MEVASWIITIVGLVLTYISLGTAHQKWIDEYTGAYLSEAALGFKFTKGTVKTSLLGLALIILGAIIGLWLT